MEEMFNHIKNKVNELTNVLDEDNKIFVESPIVINVFIGKEVNESVSELFNSSFTDYFVKKPYYK